MSSAGNGILKKWIGLEGGWGRMRNRGLGFDSRGRLLGYEKR